MVWYQHIFFTSVFFTLIVAAAPIPAALNLVRRDAGFSADSSISVTSILMAVKSSSQEIARYASRFDKLNNVPIFSDWLHLKPDVSAIHFTADMDVDCDGSTSTEDCNVDGSRQSATSWGALDASKVPFFVIPMTFRTKHENVGLEGNDLGAVICNGKMFYAIFGDENGADPQVIGEGSILLAKTCFPDDNITGRSGHDKLDVTYIVFPGKKSSKISKSSHVIDIGELKTMGDLEMKRLVAALSDGLAPDAVAGDNTSANACPPPDSTTTSVESEPTSEHGGQHKQKHQKANEGDKEQLPRKRMMKVVKRERLDNKRLTTSS